MKAYQAFKKSAMSAIIRGSMMACGMVVVSSALIPVIATAASKEDFNFTNRTGTTITGIYVAPHGTNQVWGQNCLSSPVTPGETRHISWPSESGIPIWDFRVTYSTGVEAQFEDGVNLARYGLLVVSLLEDGTVSHLEPYEI
jgi:hypothetical protein